MSKLAASLSLDLDNQWSYMRTHGDAGWESYPSYIPHLLPDVLALLRKREMKITVFIVGRDAAMKENHQALRALVEEGHEVGNHSMNHLQWLHRLPIAELHAEIADAERAIEEATGARPKGFRGPGFACNERTLAVLSERGYEYDCSIFPTFLGPLARAFYFMSSRKFTDKEADERKDLFGGVRDGLRPISPFRWNVAGRDLLEIPVTTTPVVRTPMHLSYILYLWRVSKDLARAYLHTTLTACKKAGVEPSFLLHPLDFLSGDRCPELRFFPAMDMPTEHKLEAAGEVLDYFCSSFDPIPMGEHARRLNLRAHTLGRRTPDF